MLLEDDFFHKDFGVWQKMSTLIVLLLGVVLFACSSFLPREFYYPVNFTYQEYSFKKTLSLEPDLKKVLFLRSSQENVQLYDLQNDIEIYSKYARPDAENGETQFFIRLQNSIECLTSYTPSRFYVHEIEPECFKLSSDFSPLYVEAYVDGTNRGNIKVCYSTEQLTEEKQRSFAFSVPIKNMVIENPEEIRKDYAFSQWLDATWLGEDKLGQILEKSLLSKQKVQFSGILPFSFTEEDWLIYKQGEWQKASNYEDTRGLPLARIKSIQNMNIQMEGWDAKNQRHYLFSVPPGSCQTNYCCQEDIISSVRMRTRHHVSCSLGEKRVIIKPGDWIVRQNGFWKVCKGPHSDLSFLANSQNVFFFEKIEETDQGKYVKGYFFNEQGTEASLKQIPIFATGSGGKRKERTQSMFLDSSYASQEEKKVMQTPFHEVKTPVFHRQSMKRGRRR